MGQTAAVIVAAGKGQRFGGDKVFALLGDKPVMAHTVEVFEQLPRIDTIVIVVASKNLERTRELAQERNWVKTRDICAGGLRRQDSVREGLARAGSCEWVVVHDGARPFVTARMIEDGLDAARGTGAAIAAVPVKDTVKMVAADGTVAETLDRAKLRLAQTPQIFHRDLLADAYASDEEDASDDSVLLERRGVRVSVYPGSYDNIKITTPEDLGIARCILSRLVGIT